jgi:hypothetical protein
MAGCCQHRGAVLGLGGRGLPQAAHLCCWTKPRQRFWMVSAANRCCCRARLHSWPRQWACTTSAAACWACSAARACLALAAACSVTAACRSCWYPRCCTLPL